MALHRPDEPEGPGRWPWTRDRVPASTVNRVLVVAAILGVVIFALWAITSGAIHPGGGSGDTPKATTSPTRSTQAAAGSAQPTGGSNAPVKDGDLQLQLQTVGTDAPGKLVIKLKVQNTTSLFVSFYGENQLLHSAAKQTSRGAVALTTLEPHETAGVSLVFGLPAGFRATSIELHSAPGSHGVSIPLS